MNRADNVLVVDDDELWLRTCERGFASAGRRVSCAATVAGALEVADADPPALVVTDVRLGCDSGLELLEPLRARNPACAIVITSAYLSVALSTVAIQRGATAVLFKPVHPSEILHRVDPAAPPPPRWATPTLARAEWEHICRVLSDCHGNVSEAARRLGILRQSLQRKLRKHAPVD
jgi:two-component system, response regulator RegA